MKTKILLFLCILISVFSLQSTKVFSQEENFIIKLEDIDGNRVAYSRSELIELLCKHEWTYGYLYVNFLKNGIYESGVQETYEGKWEIDEKGDIHVNPRVEGEAENLLKFKTSYCLTDEYGTEVFYNDEYYKKYNVPKESKTITEIDLINISKENLSGIWVTDDQGPMGELLGFKFTADKFYFGRPGLELPFGNWNEVDYNYKGTWRYKKDENTIEIYWKTDDFSETVKIKITKFYNGAFKGIIGPDYFFDEVGNSERIFWKSE